MPIPTRKRCILLLLLGACKSAPTAAMTTSAAEQEPHRVAFARDLAFLQEHTPIVLLQDRAGNAQVAVAPAYQGRVMTSTAGDGAASFGWINRAVIAEAKRQPHMNVFGGEDRFWLGPEGGQYALYFAPSAPFDLEHWQVPEPIDWGAWSATAQSKGEVRFAKDITLQNYQGTAFSLHVTRAVRVLEREALTPVLGVALPAELGLVAYESENTITNTGAEAWTKDKGLLSIWILGMYNPTPQTTVVIPFQPGSEAELGPIVNDAYFGKVPAARLRQEDRVLFFRGDGQERGKIGIPRPRALPIVGAYDSRAHILTLVQYTLPDDARDYVSSLWATQEQPYGGDVVNSYNDGPPEPGKPPLGPFYELETSSRAAALAPGESLTHIHRTVHLVGPTSMLDAVATQTLGVGLARIEGAFSAAGAARTRE